MNQNSIELVEQSKFIINFVFDCFIPELLDEIQKNKGKDKNKKEEDEDSKYVQMEPLTSSNFDIKTLKNVDKS
jgi:hypothetical protein